MSTCVNLTYKSVFLKLQMSKVRKCLLTCVQKSHEPIDLPHNKPVIVGRNLFSGIKDASLSKKQLQLTANTDLCTVELLPLGINPSGVNGFVVNRNKQYTLQHKDVVELLLDKYFHEIQFSPPPEAPTENSASNLKRKLSDDSDTKVTKQIKHETKSVPGWEEIDNKKLYIYTSENVESRKKIAAYDLDGTIISTKSGARFAKDKDDWKFLFPEVPKKLLKLHEDDYKIVFFTNQAGIGLGKVNIKDFRTKIENIVEKLKVPVQVFASTGKGIYRKPCPGMWDALQTQKNSNIDIDISKSFYCGDAAGRDKNWAPKKKKDHSVADLLFALNIKLKFLTPEEHFLGARKVEGIMPEFDPRKLKQLPLLLPEKSSLTTTQQEVIIFVGSPGSGKSYVCKNYLVPKNYTHINRDTLGTWQKCASALEDALKKKQSVVVDNTNPDKESRKRFVDIAKKYNVSCRCFVMNTSIQQSKHNNLFREITDKNHQIITDIIINSYRKNLQEPTMDEGYNEIIKVNCNPTFNNSDQNRLYHMFLLEK